MKSKSYIIFKYSLFLLFLQSMYAWFLWEKFILVFILVLIATFFFVSLVKEKIFVLNNSNVIPIFLIFIILFYVVRDQSTNAFFASLLRIIIISTILLLNDKIKIDLFSFLTKSFAILLLLSLFVWIIFLLGISLPHTQITFNDGQYLFDNYFFFLINETGSILALPRYSSIFLEPGQLGMITSFFLCANRFDLKRKEILVIFIGTIFTFSLAAYILLFISSFVYLISYSKNRILNIIVWSVFFVWFYSFFSTYNNGVNVINDLIFSRFGSINDEIIENNRFSEQMNDYFNKFVNSDNFLVGIGSLEYEKLFLGANAGYKVFLIQYGIIGTLFVFIFYLSIVLGKPTKMAWILFFVYILCFLQAAYPLWECELLLFIVAIPFFKFNSQK